MIDQSIFRPYDVRGRYPKQLNEEVAYLLGQAFATVTGANKVAVGRDSRNTGPSLQKAVMKGLVDMGVDVHDLGLITTDELYYTSGAKHLDGIQVSASHNPPEWNGLIFIKKDVQPTPGVLPALYKIVQKEEKQKAKHLGIIDKLDILPSYVDFLLTFIDTSTVQSLRVVANPLNGTAGPVVSALARHLPITLIPFNMEPDGNFPKGIPDPHLPEMREETARMVRSHHADLGVSWDCDGDRAVFFDENGEFVPGAYTTALFANHLLQKHPGAKIISETRVIWPVKETVEAAGGVYILNKPGHGFLKERMRQEDALLAGELSGHTFFKDFWCADNGFIPLLLMLQILSTSGKKISELLQPLRSKYFFSEEINFPISGKDAAKPILERAEEAYHQGKIDHISGVAVEFPDWRFNLRPSDNEPLLRLTIEARSQNLLDAKTAELTEFVERLSQTSVKND